MNLQNNCKGCDCLLLCLAGNILPIQRLVMCGACGDLFDMSYTDLVKTQTQDIEPLRPMKIKCSAWEDLGGIFTVKGGCRRHGGKYNGS